MASLSDIFGILGIGGDDGEPQTDATPAAPLEYRWCGARLGGRARSGCDSSGTVIHAVWTNTLVGDIDFSTAACGAKPGRTSYGFTIQSGGDTTIVTCPTCKRKMEALK
jgi:hypothetical protein